MMQARSIVVAAAVLVFVGLAATAQDPQAVEAELGLDRPARRLIQQGLADAGFDPGAPDGVFGPRTRAAIRAWQAARRVSETGYLAAAQAQALRTAATLGRGTAAADTTAAPPPTVAPPTGTDAGTARAASDAPGPTASSPAPSPAPAVLEASPAPGPPPAGCDNWNTEEFFETATVDEVTACLAGGADLAAQDADGSTPLHWASLTAEDSPVIEVLLAAGADPTARGRFDDTPLHMAAQYNENLGMRKLPHTAAEDLLELIILR